MNRGWLVLLLGLALGACRFGPLDLGNHECPCVDGWTCDTATNLCVLSSELDAAAGNGDAGIDGSTGQCSLAACTSTVHGTPACFGSSCGWDCESGWAHCADGGDTGCSTETTMDTLNCGGCGLNCNAQVANASGVTCSGALCGYASCLSGALDCDGNHANGCEAEDTDVDHCGSCSNDCATKVLNATAATCTSGACGYVGCKTGYADCNGVASDGCECVCGGPNQVCCPGNVCAGNKTCQNNVCKA